MAFRVSSSLSRQTIRNASRTGALSSHQASAAAAAARHCHHRAHRLSLRSAPRLLQPSILSCRAYATAPDPPDFLSEGELHVFNKLKSELQPEKLEVQDISGGCGSMYGVDIVSAKFAGLSVIKQHKLVNEVLKEEIKGWHGVQLKTKAP